MTEHDVNVLLYSIVFKHFVKSLQKGEPFRSDPSGHYPVRRRFWKEQGRKRETARRRCRANRGESEFQIEEKLRQKRIEAELWQFDLGNQEVVYVYLLFPVRKYLDTILSHNTVGPPTGSCFSLPFLSTSIKATVTCELLSPSLVFLLLSHFAIHLHYLQKASDLMKSSGISLFPPLSFWVTLKKFSI